MYGKSTYGVNPYGVPTGVSPEDVFSELTITVFGSGKKTLRRGNDVDVLITVLGNYEHNRLIQGVGTVTIEVFGSHSGVLIGAGFSNVSVGVEGKAEIRRFGSEFGQIDVQGVGSAAKGVVSGALTDILISSIGSGIKTSDVATVFVNAFGKATFEPIIDVDSLFWSWPVSVGYDGEHVYYTRPGDHWTKGRSDSPGSRATFRFLGEQIRARLGSDVSSGRVRVYLNGIFQEELDLFSVVEDEVFHEFMGLSAGLNEVQVIPTGLANPSSNGSDVQVEGFEYKLPIDIDDKGEEVARLAWGVMRLKAG